jgi:hypothetical protein
MEAFLFQRVGKNFRTSKFPLLYLKVPGSVPESSRFRTSKFSSRISKFLLNPDQEGDPDRLHSGPNSDVQALKPSALRPEQGLEAFPKLVRYLIGNTNLTRIYLERSPKFTPPVYGFKATLSDFLLRL